MRSCTLARVTRTRPRASFDQMDEVPRAHLGALSFEGSRRCCVDSARCERVNVPVHEGRYMCPLAGERSRCLPPSLFKPVFHFFNTRPTTTTTHRQCSDIDQALVALPLTTCIAGPTRKSTIPTALPPHHCHPPSSAMTRGDTLVALPFMALILATFARHNTLPFQKRGGLLQTSGQYHYQQQQHQPTQLPSPPDEAGGPVPPPPLPDAMVREGDTYHLPLAALRHGLRDALAWNEVRGCGCFACFVASLARKVPSAHSPPPASPFPSFQK